MVNKCPFHNTTPKLREDLPPLPQRIAKLPVGKNGYPIPYFVAEMNGSREDFRVADPAKWRACIRNRICWVCGEPCGSYLAFVIGPMCTVNRISADGFAHRECAEFSVKACPFLLRPNMVRREDEVTEQMEKNVSGIMIKRNPGVMAIWVTKTYKVVSDSQGGALFQISEPESVTWWREGREATQREVMESMATGLPQLRQTCKNTHESAMLEAKLKDALKYLPEEVVA